MLTKQPSEDTLLSFYNLESINPNSKDELNLSEQPLLEFDQIQNLSTDEQFQILTKLVKLTGIEAGPTTHTSNNDFEDPLRGRGTNVAKQLIIQRNIEGPGDPELNNYLIASKNFNPTQFLTTIHRDTPIEELFKSLEFLEHNIHSQTTELKGVIDANFTKFINCKQAIDDVLVDFKNLKSIGQTERLNSKVFNPQRHALVNKHETLSSELEESINNLNTTSSLMIRPILENKNKETKLNKLIEFIKIHPFFFDLPSNLIKHISANNHDQFIEDYHRFINEKDDYLLGKYQEDLAVISTALSKIFSEVDKIVEQYRKITFKELLSLDHEVAAPTSRSAGASLTSTKFIALVDKLSQVKESTGDSPIYNFLLNQLSNLDTELKFQVSKFDSKFAIMQNKLTQYITSLPEARQNGSHVRYIGDKYTTIEDYFMSSGNDDKKIVMEVFNSSENLDLSLVNETWLVLNNFISYLSGLFLKNLSKFVNNYKHYHSRNLDPDGVIREQFISLVLEVTRILVALFDVEAAETKQFNLIPSNYRQFLPNYTNSLSAIYYLTAISQKLNGFLTEIGNFVGTVGNFTNGADTNTIIKRLRNSSLKINQIILEATCTVWVNDCSQFYDLENWEVNKITNGDDAPTYTKLMNIVEFYQEFILIKLQKLVFPKEESEFRIVPAHPSKKILVSIEIQFVRSLNIVIDSVMKKYAIEREKDGEGIYKILAMNNFDKLSGTIYPKLIGKFDQLFDKDLLSQKLKLFTDIANASVTIFGDILDKEKLWISLKIDKFFHLISENKSATLKVDGFIYEILVHFVKLIHKVKPITGTRVFIDIINELQLHCLKNVLDKVRDSNGFSTVELINLKLDVKFFIEVFEQSAALRLNEQSMRQLDLVVKTIDEKLGGGKYSEAEFNAILDQNLQDSVNEFDCF